MDATDLHLLAQLQRDATLTNRELAARSHVSPATALRRVARLRQDGVIERQVAVLAPDRLGNVQAIVEVTLDVQTAEALDAFEALVQPLAEVQQCYRVAAGPDFVLVVCVADMAAYQALVRRAFGAQANVRNVRAFFSTRRGKFTTELPLPPVA